MTFFFYWIFGFFIGFYIGFHIGCFFLKKIVKIEVERQMRTLNDWTMKDE